jgi:hypothetical protein
MAGDWIKLEKATTTKPEVLRLASLLQCTVGEAFYYCVRFWNWCDDHLTNGHADGVTQEMLDVLIGRPGFSAQLVVVGWLQVRSGSLEVPHFERHLAESAKTRALSAKRKKKQRSSDVTQESREDRDISVTREEKRREENVSPSGDTGVRPQKRFVPPTVDEVRAYCIERGNRIDPEGFVAFYTASGWKRKGGAKVVDWKSCVITWEKNDAQFSNRSNGAASTAAANDDAVTEYLRRREAGDGGSSSGQLFEPEDLPDTRTPRRLGNSPW